MEKIQNTKYYIAATAALLTFMVYLPALRNEFVYWDDNLYIFENPYVRSLDAAFFRWAFLDFHASNWHPLTWVSHALDYAFWGLNPLGHHLTNILLHTVNTALVILMILKLLEIAREGTQPNAPASFLTDRTVLIAVGVTGLLFGIHPVHVESVAWVSERKDLLCALFFLLSLMKYVNSVRRQETGDSGNDKAGQRSIFINKHYLFALGFFVLALMSKPMAVTLPVVLLILDWYPLNRIRSLKILWTAGIEKVPFFALSLVFSILTILAQQAEGALSSIEKVSLSIRIPVAAKSLSAYLGKMLLPFDLIPFYPYPKDVSLFSFEYATAILLVIGITAVCMMLAKKHKVLISAWGYYFVTLIPVLGFVQVGGQAMADRYTYLPSLGPFLIVGVCAAWIAEKVPVTESRVLFTKIISVAVALLLLISLSYLAVQQTAIWTDSIRLWTYVIGKEPERVPIAYNNRGMVYYRTGRFDEAIADFARAITLRSSYIDAYSNLGMAFYRIGRMDKAIESFDKAIALDPRYYKAYNNRAMAFGNMGQFNKAIEDYQTVIALKPSSPQAYYNLGVLHAQTGLFDRAIEYFDRSLAADPGYADAYLSRGMAFSFIGQVDRALDDFERTLALGRNSVAVHFNRGSLYLKINRRELALADFQKACDLGYEAGCSMAVRITQGLSPQ